MQSTGRPVAVTAAAASTGGRWWRPDRPAASPKWPPRTRVSDSTAMVDMVVQDPRNPTQAKRRTYRQVGSRFSSRSIDTVRMRPRRKAPEVLMTNVETGKCPVPTGHVSCRPRSATGRPRAPPTAMAATTPGWPRRTGSGARRGPAAVSEGTIESAAGSRSGIEGSSWRIAVTARAGRRPPATPEGMRRCHWLPPHHP